MKKIIILGATGSIGQQTLQIIDKQKDKFEVVGLTAKSNDKLLSKLVDKYKPRAVGLVEGRITLGFNDYSFFSGKDCNEKLIKEVECDLVVNALVGASGLLPTMQTLKSGMKLALANKESLVMAGDLVTSLAKDKSIDILPIDSEHSAIWQCLDFNKNKQFNKILLTCSGGAFRDFDKQTIENLKAKDALKHPVWNMGGKVTIDSCTLMNKGLEVIEAMFLFNKKVEDVKVILHKESIIHSMVEFVDGSIIAQMSSPDMRLPIQVALNYPDRGSYNFKPLSFDDLSLSFGKPDLEKFPCLDIAVKCADKDDSVRTVMNAANEFLVNEYLEDVIKFYDIPYYINVALDKYSSHTCSDAESLLELNDSVIEFLNERLNKESK